MRPNRRKKPRKKRAFTLVEVVVAASLLLIGIVPILSALTSALTTTAFIEQKTHCLAIAQGKIEEIKAKSIYNWPSNGAYNENKAWIGSYRYSVSDKMHFSQNYRTLTVTSGYDSNKNGILNTDEILITLTTLIARRD